MEQKAVSRSTGAGDQSYRRILAVASRRNSGPASKGEERKRRTTSDSPIGINKGVGGPAGSKEAAKRCTEIIRTVGPTLNKGELENAKSLGDLNRRHCGRSGPF